MKISPHAPLLAVALMACACQVSTLPVALAPPGVTVRSEVARGYAAYEAPLAAFGTWAPDREHGVHWCPSASATGGAGADFRPYVSRGHWEVSEAAGAASGGAPGASPVWRSEDSDTWGEITTHHGWWVPVPHRLGSDAPAWCWVPGLEETPARVAWREGDGFVGWAPEPPFWVAADEADYDDSLDWVFTLLGTLVDAVLDHDVLSGPARDMARAATAPAVARTGSFRSRHVGPSGASVGAARLLLTTYVLEHPDAIAAAAAQPSGESGGRSDAHASSSDSSGSKSSGKSGLTLTAGSARTLFAMTYFDAFQMVPLLGPPGLVPRMSMPGPAAGEGGDGGEAGSRGGGGGLGAVASSAGEGRSQTVRGAASESRGAAAGHASSAASSSARTYTYSYHSSSASEGGSSHSSSHSGHSSHSHR